MQIMLADNFWLAGQQLLISDLLQVGYKIIQDIKH